MKAITAAMIVILFIVILGCIVGVLIYMQVGEADIENYISSTFTGCGRAGEECCKNGWCTTDLTCSADNICIQEGYFEVKFDESYLIYNSSETATVQQRNDFFDMKTGAGEEDCSNMLSNSCSECEKLQNFVNAETCSYCLNCNDTDTGYCESCLGCDSAENGVYNELYYCSDCSGCNPVSYDASDSCSQCAFCDVANETHYENGLSCSSCFQCDSTTCYSCWDCGASDEKIECKECRRSGSTACKSRNDYIICDKVKEAIVNYDFLFTEIDEMLPLPWSSSYSFATTVADKLTDCVSGDIEGKILGNISQKICDYDNSRINFVERDFESDVTYTPASSNLEMLIANQYDDVTGETKGILFNSCGIEMSPGGSDAGNDMFYNDPELFESETTPRTSGNDIPVNLKIVINNVSWNEGTGGDCSYDIYLCAQEAIALSEDDPILNIYRNFTYLNESDYSEVNKWPTENDGGYEINVTAIKYPKFRFNVSGRSNGADVAHIAKAIVAGLRDYFTFNSQYNGTVGLFCENSGRFKSTGECVENDISVLLNDRIPWKLEGGSVDTMSLTDVPYKYIYYDPSTTLYHDAFDVELTFFSYSSNIDKINHTIFVTPVIVIGNPSAEEAEENMRILGTCEEMYDDSSNEKYPCVTESIWNVNNKASCNGYTCECTGSDVERVKIFDGYVWNPNRDPPFCWPWDHCYNGYGSLFACIGVVGDNDWRPVGICTVQMDEKSEKASGCDQPSAWGLAECSGGGVNSACTAESNSRIREVFGNYLWNEYTNTFGYGHTFFALKSSSSENEIIGTCQEVFDKDSNNLKECRNAWGKALCDGTTCSCYQGTKTTILKGYSWINGENTKGYGYLYACVTE